MLNKKIFYWILFVIIFGDLLLGGITFVLTLDYWNFYMAFPINMIESAGFTLGFSLIPLTIYCFFVYQLFIIAKSLEKKYIDYLFKGILVVLFLYAIGFTGQFIRLAKSSVDRKHKEILIQENLFKFQKDVSVNGLSIKKVEGTFDTYKANFVINIPNEYIFDRKTYLGLHVDSTDTVSEISTYLYYIDGKIVETSDNLNIRNPNEIKLVFNDNGDLDINVEYIFIKPYNKDEAIKDQINVELTFRVPNCYDSSCPIGSEWKYNTKIDIPY